MSAIVVDNVRLLTAPAATATGRPVLFEPTSKALQLWDHNVREIVAASSYAATDHVCVLGQAASAVPAIQLPAQSSVLGTLTILNAQNAAYGYVLAPTGELVGDVNAIALAPGESVVLVRTPQTNGDTQRKWMVVNDTIVPRLSSYAYEIMTGNFQGRYKATYPMLKLFRQGRNAIPRPLSAGNGQLRFRIQATTLPLASAFGCSVMLPGGEVLLIPGAYQRICKYNPYTDTLTLLSTSDLVATESNFRHAVTLVNGRILAMCTSAANNTDVNKKWYFYLISISGSAAPTVTKLTSNAMVYSTLAQQQSGYSRMVLLADGKTVYIYPGSETTSTQAARLQVNATNDGFAIDELVTTDSKLLSTADALELPDGNFISSSNRTDLYPFVIQSIAATGTPSILWYSALSGTANWGHAGLAMTLSGRVVTRPTASGGLGPIYSIDTEACIVNGTGDTAIKKGSGAFGGSRLTAVTPDGRALYVGYNNGISCLMYDPIEDVLVDTGINPPYNPSIARLLPSGQILIVPSVLSDPFYVIECSTWSPTPLLEAALRSPLMRQSAA